MNIYAMPLTSPQFPETPINKGDQASEVTLESNQVIGDSQLQAVHH